MKKLIKVNNTDVIFKLNLNYESVHSNLRMLLGSDASFFAEIAPMASYTTWYASKDMDYKQLKDASEPEVEKIMSCLNSELFKIRQQLGKSPQFAPYVDSLLMFPGIDFVFYLPLSGGKYEFVVAGWGCDRSHSNPVGGVFSGKAGVSKDKFEKDDKNFSGEEFTEFDKEIRLDEPVEKSVPHKNELPQEDISEVFKDVNGIHAAEKHTYLQQKQNVLIRVLDQNSNPVSGENVIVKSAAENGLRISDERGIVEVGIMNVSDIFTVTFPNRNNVERSFVVEKDNLIYDVFIKKLIKSAPQLFVEDQNGLPVSDHKIKVIAAGKEMTFDTGETGVVQLPIMQEGQKFIVVDTANYANTTEFELTPKKAEAPYHFIIPRKAKQMVGICVQDKDGNPMPGVTIEMADSNVPCFKTTDAGGRAEFPKELFNAAKIPLILKTEGMNPIKYKLKFNPSETEYGIVIKDKSFNWKWLGLIPVLAGLVWGAFAAIDSTPSWNELSRGVVLIKCEELFTVETGLPQNTGLSTLYFNYSANERMITRATFNENDAQFDIGWGTGFFISDDGKIATNRHVASPIAPEETIIGLLREFFVDNKQIMASRADKFQKEINKYSHLRSTNNKELHAILDVLDDSLSFYRNMANMYDRMLTISNFKVNTICNTYVAFDNSMIQSVNDQAFHPCTCLAYGEPGDVNSNDVAIIQLNEKEKLMPKDAYIFKVPTHDPLPSNKEHDSDYEVWVLGYNKGIGLAGIEVGIHPQYLKGNVSSVNDKYLIQYHLGVQGGTSGSPVLNKKRELVAVNNSGFNSTNISYGVRTVYLYELMKQIKDKEMNQ